MLSSTFSDTRRQIRLLIWLLAFLILCNGIYAGYVYHFNHTVRSYVPGDTDAPFTVSIGPRTGLTDSWVKNTDQNGTTIPLYGVIYDVTIANAGVHAISRWDMTIHIPRACYLNNAWCGTFDIHQHVEGREKIQNIDLRNYVQSELYLNYNMESTDLMIPLATNDYLVYRPDAVTKEFPIAAPSESSNPSVVFGMILYTGDPATLDLNNFRLNYYLEQSYTQSWVFVLLSIGFLFWFILLCVFALVAWNMRKAHERFRLDDRIISQSIGVFTHFFEAKDIYTTGHSQRVAEYSMLLGQKLGFAEDASRQLYYIGLMHDCGKCYIPDEILKKPGKLTSEEYEIIKSHTKKGAEMLVDFTSIDHIRDGVLYHHERYDGNGYPEGLSGKNIPLVARIICISDSFDAMNSRRCYRDMRSKEYILSELEGQSGKQFDPDLVPIFVGLIKEGKIHVASE